MKHIEMIFSQLLGKALTFNALAKSSIKSTEKTETVNVGCVKNGRNGFYKIGSKKLYGSSLLVNRLMSY